MPLRPYVLPFLKANIPLISREVAGLAVLNCQTPLQYLRAHQHLLADPPPPPPPSSTATLAATSAAPTASPSASAAGGNATHTPLCDIVPFHAHRSPISFSPLFFPHSRWESRRRFPCGCGGGHFSRAGGGGGRAKGPRVEGPKEEDVVGGERGRDRARGQQQQQRGRQRTPRATLVFLLVQEAKDDAETGGGNVGSLSHRQQLFSHGCCCCCCCSSCCQWR